MYITIRATNPVLWQQHNLKSFREIGHAIISRNVYHLGKCHNGEWFYIDEPNKIVYYGHWAKYLSIEDPESLFANIFQDEEEFQECKQKWLELPECIVCDITGQGTLPKAL